ncbi:YhzD family protein [Chryseomicrobium sp. FSL W7-1435]|uniref:YhzD family protein n=1 Tax=Chryseomicrobium sp. FSL W7-1435 TaxID=2921704 RepID=UPI00315A962E
MKLYTFTAFEKSGKLLAEEKWEYATDEEAKRLGEKRVEELGYGETTHRLVNTSGKLVLFHV